MSETDAEVADIMNPPASNTMTSQDDDVAYSPDAQVPEEDLESEGTATDDAETPRIERTPVSADLNTGQLVVLLRKYT